MQPEVPSCPEVLEQLAQRLLAKDPADRYQTASEVAIALADVLRDKGSLPPGNEPEALALRELVARARVRRKLDQLAAAKVDEEGKAGDTAKDPATARRGRERAGSGGAHGRACRSRRAGDPPCGPRSAGTTPPSRCRGRSHPSAGGAAPRRGAAGARAVPAGQAEGQARGRYEGAVDRGGRGARGVRRRARCDRGRLDGAGGGRPGCAGQRGPTTAGEAGG